MTTITNAAALPAVRSMAAEQMPAVCLHWSSTGRPVRSLHRFLGSAAPVWPRPSRGAALSRIPDRCLSRRSTVARSGSPRTEEGAMPAATYNHALHRANVWLADVTDALGTNDRHYGRRVLRTWLHTLRDRLTVDAAAKFGQQLPELFPGPSTTDGANRVPMKYNTAQYVRRFSTDALVPHDEVPGIASIVTLVISEHMSPGQVAETLAELPADLLATVRDGADVREGPGGRQPSEPSAALEDRINALGEAVRTLARGLEDERASGQRIDASQVARAARGRRSWSSAAGRLRGIESTGASRFSRTCSQSRFCMRRTLRFVGGARWSGLRA